eukprot:1247009-Heterocapsa_arctica.AAC.1
MRHPIWYAAAREMTFIKEVSRGRPLSNARTAERLSPMERIRCRWACTDRRARRSPVSSTRASFTWM